jgi:hypothetical protein
LSSRIYWESASACGDAAARVKGASQNAEDVMLTRGIDFAIVQTDVLDFPAPEHLATAAALGGAGSHGLHRASCAEASQEKQACHDDQGEMTQSPSYRCPRKASSTMSPRAEQSRIAAAIIATGFTVGWQRPITSGASEVRIGLSAGGSRIRTLGPYREGRRKSGSQRTRWWAGGVRPGRLEDVCCGKNCSAFTGGFLLNLTDWQKISVSRVKR